MAHRQWNVGDVVTEADVSVLRQAEALGFRDIRLYESSIQIALKYGLDSPGNYPTLPLSLFQAAAKYLDAWQGNWD